MKRHKKEVDMPGRFHRASSTLWSKHKHHPTATETIHAEVTSSCGWSASNLPVMDLAMTSSRATFGVLPVASGGNEKPKRHKSNRTKQQKKLPNSKDKTKKANTPSLSDSRSDKSSFLDTPLQPNSKQKKKKRKSGDEALPDKYKNFHSLRDATGKFIKSPQGPDSPPKRKSSDTSKSPEIKSTKSQAVSSSKDNNKKKAKDKSAGAHNGSKKAKTKEKLKQAKVQKSKSSRIPQNPKSDSAPTELDADSKENKSSEEPSMELPKEGKTTKAVSKRGRPPKAKKPSGESEKPADVLNLSSAEKVSFSSGIKSMQPKNFSHDVIDISVTVRSTSCCPSFND